MKRPTLNFLIDVTAFVAFVFLLSTGLLLRYTLPPGSGRIEGGGTGAGADNRLISLLGGQSRHDWGDFHYWIALVLVAVLALHLVLHWKWIVCMIRGTKTSASGMRFGVGLASLAALVALAAAPFLVPVEHVARHELREALTVGDHGDGDVPASDWGHLRGSLTLAEAAAECGVSVDTLRKELGLPDDLDSEERIGRSLRAVGKRMSDLHRLHDSAPKANLPKPQEARP
jgi:hypothetical protein